MRPDDRVQGMKTQARLRRAEGEETRRVGNGETRARFYFWRPPGLHHETRSCHQKKRFEEGRSGRVTFKTCGFYLQKYNLGENQNTS